MEKKQEIKFDFGWGNPYFLLELLNALYWPDLSTPDIKKMSYAPDEGNPELIKQTKKIIKDITGQSYDHILITNGATHAINTILRYYKRQGYEEVLTREYGYPFYADMIKRAGLDRVIVSEIDTFLPKEKQFALIDSPSNPKGLQTGMGSDENTVWDSVYHNKIYTDDLDTIPPHYWHIGSYSKLLGLTGARVGWIATNNAFAHALITDECLKDNATISVPSQDLIIDIIKRVDLDRFLNHGKRSLNNNRETIQKIEYLFDGQPVQSSGMFYCANADKKTIELLNNCGIQYVNLGDNYIRLSLGQTGKITKEAIEALLKKDKIK